MSIAGQYLILGLTSTQEVKDIDRSDRISAQVEFIESGDLTAAVIPAISDEKFSFERKYLAKYYDIVERLHESLTIIPFKYGTTATEQEIGHLLRVRENTYLRMIHSLQGRTEVSARWFMRREREKTSLSSNESNARGRSYLLDRVAAKEREKAIEASLITSVGQALEKDGITAKMFSNCYRLQDRIPSAEDVLVASVDLLVLRSDSIRTERMLRTLSLLHTKAAVVQGAHLPYSFLENQCVQNDANSAGSNVDESKRNLKIIRDSTDLQSRAFT